MRIVRASEIGEYVYCRRAWWLRRVRGLASANAAEMAAGAQAHAAHGRGVSLAGLLRLAAWLVLAAAAAWFVLNLLAGVGLAP